MSTEDFCVHRIEHSTKQFECFSTLGTVSSPGGLPQTPSKKSFSQRWGCLADPPEVSTEDLWHRIQTRRLAPPDQDRTFVPSQGCSSLASGVARWPRRVARWAGVPRCSVPWPASHTPGQVRQLHTPLTDELHPWPASYTSGQRATPLASEPHANEGSLRNGALYVTGP